MLLLAVTGTCGVTIQNWRKKVRIRSHSISKEPDWDGFKDFLKGEVRFASVMKQYPDEAATLFQAAEDNAKWRLNSYKRLANQQWSAE
jgi:pyruvate/2-oxoacid:ferredoxin oxidoreductase beta subunit